MKHCSVQLASMVSVLRHWFTIGSTLPQVGFIVLYYVKSKYHPAHTLNTMDSAFFT